MEEKLNRDKAVLVVKYLFIFICLAAMIALIAGFHEKITNLAEVTSVENLQQLTIQRAATVEAATGSALSESKALGALPVATGQKQPAYVHLAEAQARKLSGAALTLAYSLIAVFLLMAFCAASIKGKTMQQTKKSNRQQEINYERYGILTEQSGSIIFEYDLVSGTAYHTENFMAKFGYDPVSENYLEMIKRSGHLHEKDEAIFMELHEGICRGRKYGEAEVRMRTAEGEYLWIRIKATGIFDDRQNPLRIVGKMIDVTADKRELESLKAEVNRDSGTGLYNKKTTRTLIDSYLEGEGNNGHHALLIIDIDDFKNINDELGHRKGDDILLLLAEQMKTMFRADDIVGRIGGDEFMVLVKNISDRKLVEEKARMICCLFNQELAPSGLPIAGRRGAVKVSSSVGIALYNEDGTTYEELYEAADHALYSCKFTGKGSCLFYAKSYNEPT